LKSSDSTTRSALHVWDEICAAMQIRLGKPLHIVYPGRSHPYYQWFVEIESGAFRPELRYSQEELEKRLENNNLLFLFLTSDEEREGVVLAYDDPDSPDDTLYLDTIAVKKTRQGLGRVLMDALVRYARIKEYRAIRLDTETVNERGHELVKFYQSLGFSETDATEDGNISMMLNL
jgi:ribosomal protein S18 acetylase RimI-like enzyme